MVVLVVMGVCGSGKTTIAKLLSRKIGCEFADADDWHPAANIDKMKQGIPLNDDDRQPWLVSLNKLLLQWEQATASRRHAPQLVGNQVAAGELVQGEDTQRRESRRGVEMQRESQTEVETDRREARETQKTERREVETHSREVETLERRQEETHSREVERRQEETESPDSRREKNIGHCLAADLKGQNIGPPGSWGVSGILACSALKRAYRHTLSSGTYPSSKVKCIFVVLNGNETLIRERMSRREHFMPPGLLRSQFQALELPSGKEEGGNPVIMVDDISPPATEIGDYILCELKLVL